MTKAKSQAIRIPTDPHLKTKPKICIVGFADGHRMEAPFKEPDYEFWGINRLHTGMPPEIPWTRWFNLHDLEKFHGQDLEHLDFLSKFPGPVYLRPQDIGKFPVPNAIPFPWTLLKERFGGYFNNTIAWLLAYAITMEPQEIAVYGVDMAADSIMGAGEYQHQRPSCEFFLGIAAGLGIELRLPAGTDLLKTTHLYGFEDPGPFMQKLETRLQELGGRKEKAKAEMAQLEYQYSNQKQQLFAAINQFDGAMQDAQFWARNMATHSEGSPYNPLNGQAPPTQGDVDG